MTFTLSGVDEFVDLAKLIGLLDASGNLDASFFSAPLAKAGGAFTHPDQRDALLRFLEGVLPAHAVPGRPPGQKWHPLLGPQQHGNLYLTAQQDGGGVLLGIGGEFGSGVGAPVQGRVLLHLPLLHAGSTVDVVAGTSAHPLDLELRIEVGWPFDPVNGHPVGLSAIVARATIVPDPNAPSFHLAVVLEGLALTAGPPVDKALDVAALGAEVPELVSALLKVVLAEVSADPTVTLLADHLLALLGLGDSDSIPALPFTTLGDGPAALQQWVKEVVGAVDGTPATATAWLAHLVGLFDHTGAVTGDGTAAIPWSAPLVALAGVGDLALTLAHVAGHLQVGLAGSVGGLLGAGAPRLDLTASFVLADVPLDGLGHAKPLPSASVTARFGRGANRLVDDAAVRVRSARGGLLWDGNTIRPVLELLDVQFAGHPYPRLDLTNTDSVASAAAGALLTVIDNALGAGLGRRLAALVGLVAPEDPARPGQELAGWGHQLEVARLVTDPAGAIAAYHRSVLLDGVRWGLLLRETALLLGLAGVAAGTGTAADPWRFTLASPAAGTALELVAWNAQTLGAGAPQQLRMGLRFDTRPTGAVVSWTAELLAFDLPATGPGRVAVLGAQELRLGMAPALDTVVLEEVRVALASLEGVAHWTPGGALELRVQAQGLSITVDGSTLTLNHLQLPPAGGFDIANPAATAAALGLTATALEDTFRWLLTVLASQLGKPGVTASALLGLHHHLAGLPEDLPSLVDPALPGRLLQDPLGALQAWLGKVLLHVSAGGDLSFSALLNWLVALAADALPADVHGFAPTVDVLEGAGTFEQPWRLPWPGGGQDGPDLELWLEPAGPPTSWAAGIATRAAAAQDPADLAAVLRTLGYLDDGVRSLAAGLTVRELADQLEALTLHLASGDGVVPLESQSPDIFGWEHGTTVTSAHNMLPRDPAVIAQVLAQIEALSTGGQPRLVLLVGPRFSDHTAWADLLAAPARQGSVDAGAHFDLRRAGIDPLTVSLDDVTAVADYYTADLSDTGTAAPLVTQLSRIAARLAVLRPGATLTVVAHSTAALAARAFCAAEPTRARGLITLGAPHLGAPLPFLTDDTLGGAIRLAGTLRTTMAASPLRDALDHLLDAVEGYAPPAAPGQLPTPIPYPASSFTTPAPFDLGPVPVLALTSQLVMDPVTWLRDAVTASAQAVVAQVRPAPTHLAAAIAMPMDLGPPQPGDVDAEVRVRMGMFHTPLHAGPPPARSASFLNVSTRLRRDGGWLLGSAAVSNIDGRARELELAVHVAPGSPGVVTGRLPQAAWRGRTAANLDLTDARSAPLLGEIMRAVFTDPAILGPQTANLLAALSAVDLLTADNTGAVGLSNDGFAALRADPLGYLRARIPAVLTRPLGWAGLGAGAGDPATGPWRWQPPGSPYALFVRKDGANGPWHVGIESEAGNAGELSLGVDLNVTLPAVASTAEVFLDMGVTSLRYRSADGTITLDAPPWLEHLQLWPTPALANLAATFNDALPRILLTGALGVALPAVAPGVSLTALEQLLRTPGEFLVSAASLGRPDGGFDGPRLASLLQAVNTAVGFAAGPGLQLPGDLSVTVSGGASATDPLHLGLSTTAPLGGVLGLALSLDLDASRHVTPAGTLTLQTPLTGTWPHIAITFGASAAGVTLVVTPQGVAPMQILPTFSGLGALRGGAEALLPAVLDAALGTAAVPHATWLQHLLAASAHLGIYDDPGGFRPHTAVIAAMLEATWFASFDAGKRHDVALALVDLLTLIPGLPGTLSASGGGLVQWALLLPPAGTMTLAAGWGDDGPVARLAVADMAPGNTPLRAGASVLVGGTGIDASLSVGVDLTSLGVPLTPRAEVGLATPGALRFTARLLPLASGADDGPLVVHLAPAFSVDLGTGTAERILTDWALPLVVQVAVLAAHDALTRPLWTGGPTLSEALKDAKILTAGGAVAHPLPDVWVMLTGALEAAAPLLDLPIRDLHLKLQDQSGRIGLALHGFQDIPLGDLDLSLRFGAPANWGSAATEGLVVYLFEVGSSGAEFNVGLQLHGVGVSLSRTDGTPLVNEDILRLGGVRAYLFLDLETKTGLVVEHPGAGLELTGFGIPLGVAMGGGGGNPVARNLLQSGGAPGDGTAVNPSSDLDVWYWDNPASPGGPLHVLIGGQSGILWIGVHAGFGPVYIEQVGIGLTSTQVSLLIDGGVTVAGLSAQVDDLEITVPFAHLSDPSQWSLDLKGLAVGYSGPAISIAGGLVKFDGPPLEYDGMLLVKLASIGAIVIGSYAVVGSGPDEYTSFAIFGGVFIPIGIPPIINLTGLALGLGYNRRLIVPEDLNAIPDFMLVKALDRPEDLANNPMQALYAFRAQVPPSRGALWIAAGLRGTCFEIVNITAVLYVALDRGVEVGLLGVARMALPSDDAALVSIELALKARFSSAEGLFSLQAQLTDNSWLISHDCQLTGGFAFFMWFRESQFLLTLGGYHPAFQPRPEYPVVPRLGFRWNFLGVVHIKGESYFALTNTCVMTGFRMEASYGPDWLQLWFTAYTDILISWDPFHYDVSLGIAVGARLRIEICFFGCVHIEISVSVGASLHILGPPFHGVAEIDLGVTSVTVAFGDDARTPPPALHWDAFVAKYLQSGDPNAAAVSAQVLAGLLPAEPAGAPVAPGTETQPWRLSAEWAFATETRMPVRSFRFQSTEARTPADMTTAVFGTYTNLAETFAFDLAPMYVSNHDLVTLHRVVLARQPEGGGAFVDMVPRGTASPDPALVLDERLFKVATHTVQVSEATYHFYADFKPPAAANTLPVLGGLRLDGIAGLHGESLAIPIGKLVDATNYRPLPFAHRGLDLVRQLKLAGRAAESVAKLVDQLNSKHLLEAYADLLSGPVGPFATLRSETGLPTDGYDPRAAQALRTRRSAPPALSSLAAGMSMRDVGVGTPPQRTAPLAAELVTLERPRLRAILQHQLAPTTPGPSVLHTTAPLGVPGLVVDAALTDIRRLHVDRDLVRSLPIAGAALLVQPAPDAPRPTRAARSVHTIRHPDVGPPQGRTLVAALARASEEVLADGTTLRAGITHIWDVPLGASTSLVLNGDMAVRVTMLGRSGAVLRDLELSSLDREVPLPEGCAMVSVTGLGRTTVDVDPAPGAVTTVAAPADRLPTVGWQLGSYLAQVGPTTLLGRGCTLSLSQKVAAPVSGFLAATGMLEVSRAMLVQSAVETRLPQSVTVIGILVDHDHGVGVTAEGLQLHLEGLTVAADPVVVQADNTLLFLYDVQPSETVDATGTASVTVGLRGGLVLSGVVGLRGTAQAWGHSLGGAVLAHLVPDEALSADGEVRLRMVLRDNVEVG